MFEVLRLLQNQVCTNTAASGNRGRKRNQGITMIWVFHLPNIYSAWKATLLARNMEEEKNRQYLANYLHDNSDSENTQDANI